MSDQRTAVVVLVPVSQLAQPATHPGSDQVLADCGHLCWLAPGTHEVIHERMRAGAVVRTTCLDCLPDAAWLELVPGVGVLPPGWRATQGVQRLLPSACPCRVPLEAVNLVDGRVTFRRTLRRRNSRKVADKAQQLLTRAMLQPGPQAVMSYVQCPDCQWTVVLLHAVREP